MKWKILIFVSLLACPIQARPQEQITEALTKTTTTTTTKSQSPSTTTATTATTTTTTESTKDNHSSLRPQSKKNETTHMEMSISSIPSNAAIRSHPSDRIHKGEAVPMTLEDMEREMAAVDIRLKESSTSKEGISTWILLSSGNKPTNQPDVKTEVKPPTARIEADQKIDKIAKVDEKPATKKKPEPTTVKPKKQNRPTPTNKPQEDVSEKINKNKAVTTAMKKKPQNQQNKKQESQEDALIETTTKKMKRTTTTTTTTIEPSTESATIYPMYEPLDNIESSTFLILEPKDADFDLPEDRSPGDVKKPKRPVNKNKKKAHKKKPQNKLNDAIDILKNNTKISKIAKKPDMSTKIYNYLAREVMPTVGVGLVGLVVAGGLATYFFSPFGALRRSYDIADRKDDIYHYNNEEYAGSDGQNEEDMFGKVIAGMPSSSMYRNNVRIQGAYRPNQGYQTGAHLNTGYNKYATTPYNNRYRNAAYVRQTPYQHPQQQQQPQQQYRYNPEGIAKKSNVPAPVYSSQITQDISSVYSVEAQDKYDSVASQTNAPSAYMDNTLQHRTQFVVGSVVPENVAASETVSEKEISTTAPVPEHGPRKRRDVKVEEEKSRGIENNEISDSENEIDGVVNETTTADAAGSTELPTELPKDVETESTTYGEDIQPSDKNNLFGFVQRIFELKVRLGISFLQNATTAFQRYLRGVERRVDSTGLFDKQK